MGSLGQVSCALIVASDGAVASSDSHLRPSTHQLFGHTVFTKCHLEYQVPVAALHAFISGVLPVLVPNGVGSHKADVE